MPHPLCWVSQQSKPRAPKTRPRAGTLRTMLSIVLILPSACILCHVPALLYRNLFHGRPLQRKSTLLGILFLLPACFTAGQMYMRANPYNASSGRVMGRGAYSVPQAYWGGRRWNSVQQLSNPARANESQRYAVGGPPVQNAQPQMTGIPVQGVQPQMSSSQTMASPTASVSSQLASSQTMERNRTFPSQTTVASSNARSVAPSYSGVSGSVQPLYSEASNLKVTQEGTSQSYASGAGPSTTPGGTGNVPTAQYNDGAATNRFNSLRPMTSRPFDANMRYTQSGRTTSSFMGIASGDPYSSYSSRGAQGNQPADQPESGDPESSSTGTSDGEETESTDTEEEESAEVESSGGLGTRRVMNPYDLSHIFPDIYQEEQPPSYENMTNQSLALLEMTTINSDPDGE